MPDTQTDDVVDEDALDPDSVIRIDLPSGMPLYVADHPDVVDYARTKNHPMFYVLGQQEKTYKQGTNSWTENRPTFFRVMKTFIGESMTEIGEEDFEFELIKPWASWNLPLMPGSFVARLDQFFRVVDARKGTEAIVILTFDPSYIGQENAPEGWGFLVPAQTNTGASCKYDPQSIIDDKPDEVFIVGSAHSHPGMSAYASHTDVGDQASFDGLHITFGWMRSNGDKTEHHIELQLQGTRFTMKREDVFAEVPLVDADDELEAWLAKVEKSTGVTPGKSTSSTNTGTGGTGGSSTKTTPSQYKLPEGCPSPRDVGLIVELLQSETHCPVCMRFIASDDLARRRCTECQSFFARPNDTLQQVVEARNAKNMSTTEIDINSNPWKSIWFWKRYKLPSGEITETLTQLHKGERDIKIGTTPPKA